MPGVLQFTLGLEASNFLRNAGLASGQILGLASAGNLLQSAMENVWGAIEHGGALNDLSNRTGESIRNLFQLQEAFTAVGIGADSVSPMLIQLQRAMSGMDESGQRTDKVFASLGLDLKKLRELDAPRQFELLAGALKKIDKNQAAGIASALFGREGAGNFLQLARDFEGFKQSFKDSGEAAAVWQRASAGFDTIGDSVGTLKMKLRGMWAGVADGAAPAIQSILDGINGVNFVSFGQRLGREITIAVESINLNRFEQYFSLSMQAAVQDAANSSMEIIQRLSGGLHPDNKTPETSSFLNKAGNAAGGVGIGLLGIWDRFGELLGVPGAADLAEKRISAANEFFEKAGIADGILIHASEAFTKGIEGLPNKYREQLEQFRTGMLKSAEFHRPDSKDRPDKATLNPELVTKSAGQPNVTSLEKIGLVIGGNRPGRDMSGERLVQNTFSMIQIANLQLGILRSLPSLLTGGNGFKNI